MAHGRYLGGGGLGRVGGDIVPVFGGFVTNQAQHSPHNVPNDELVGLRRNKLPANQLNAADELIDGGPSVPGDDLEKDVGGRSGTGLGAPDLSSF